MQPFEHGLLLGWEVSHHAVEKERRLVQQTFRRLNALNDDAARQDAEAGVFFRRQFLPGKNYHGQVGQRWRIPEPLQDFKTIHIRKAQVKHHAIERSLFCRGQRFCSGRSNRNVNVVVTEQFPDADLFRRIVFDNQQSLAARRRVFLNPAEGGLQRFGTRGFGNK